MKVNAVFEGGGVKAIGLVGAIRAAEQFGFSFRHVAGTSSGAIVSALLMAGYTSKELQEMLYTNPFKQFVQKTWVHRFVGIGPTMRLLFKKGLYSGMPVRKWVDEKLRAKGVRYFDDVPEGSLRIIASDITQGKMLVLPDDLESYGIIPGSFKIADAVAMSAALPYFFDPVVLKPRINEAYYVVDGAILSNYPLFLFDEPERNSNQKVVPTIGFRLVGKQDYESNRIRGPASMFRALFSTMMNAHDEKYIDKHAQFRTIKIPTLGIKTADFDITEERMDELYRSGLNAGRDFFMKWSVSEYLLHYEQMYSKQKQTKGKRED